MKKSRLSILTAGIIKENPVLILVLGTCPTLAVSTSAINAIGMGIAATVVLLGSNVIISLLRKIIPDRVRIPVYITIIAGFVTVVQIVIQALSPALNSALGIYLPLIVVNCIILARAEMFAAKNGVLDSALDAVGMGAGFTVALLCMGIVRELLGAGTLFGITITAGLIPAMTLMILPPGGFFVYGIMMALCNKLAADKKPRADGCEGCQAAEICGKTDTDTEEVNA